MTDVVLPGQCVVTDAFDGAVCLRFGVDKTNSLAWVLVRREPLPLVREGKKSPPRHAHLRLPAKYQVCVTYIWIWRGLGLMLRFPNWRRLTRSGISLLGAMHHKSVTPARTSPKGFCA
jgi:hypothetical protein